MHWAVQFDDDGGGVTVKIHDEAVDDLLAAELETAEPIRPEAVPLAALRWRHPSAEFFGPQHFGLVDPLADDDVGNGDPGKNPSPRPPPRSGEGESSLLASPGRDGIGRSNPSPRPPPRSGEGENFLLASPGRDEIGRSNASPRPPPRSGEGENFLLLSRNGESVSFLLLSPSGEIVNILLPSPLRGGVGGGVPDSLAHRPAPVASRTESSVRRSLTYLPPRKRKTPRRKRAHPNL